MNYSVPYEYIKRRVDVRLTKNMVEIFYDGNRVASHVRRHGRPGQYATLPEHMSMLRLTTMEKHQSLSSPVKNPAAAVVTPDSPD
jgi:hypothetical protein